MIFRKILFYGVIICLLSACEGVDYTSEQDIEADEPSLSKLVVEQTTKSLVNVAFSKGAEYISEKRCEQNNTCSDFIAEEYIVPDNSEVSYISNYDGDTIKFAIISDIDKYNNSPEAPIIDVRLLLIDTTEIKGANNKPDYLALEAKYEVERILKSATNIHIEYDRGDKKDKYGRHLMHVFVDGESLQKTLLSNGLAKIRYVFKPNIRYLNDYEAAENFARENKLGLWGVDS